MKKMDKIDSYTDLRSKISMVADQEMSSKSRIEKTAYGEAAFFLMNKVDVNKDDILAGKFEIKCNCSSLYPANMKQELSFLVNTDATLAKKYEGVLVAEEAGLFTRSPGAHAIPCFEELICEGIQHRIDRVKQCLKETDSALEGSKRNFYLSVLILLSAMQERILKYAQEALNQYEISGKPNLRRIYEACKRIAYYPPAHFFEAVQLVLLVQEHVLSGEGSGSMSFGRMDQYLYPLYEKDLREKVICKDEAQEIITALWKKIAQYEMSWQNVTLGGSDKSGKDMCNDLTLLCMNASLAVKGDQPQVSLRVHEGMPESVWNKAFDLIQTGMGFPELYNDQIAVKAKLNAGISEEDAWNYSIVGCVELSAGGKEYSHTEGARFNWTKILELMLQGGKCSITGCEILLAENHNLDEFTDFTDFYAWYKRELVYYTEYICDCIDLLSDQYARYWPVPFLSSVMHGCIEKGRDVTDSGAIYNNLTVNCVGIASVADSLEAIETLVFKDKMITLTELAVILKNNFEGYEAIQKKMLSCAKYGNDILSVDRKVKELTELFTDTLSKRQMKYRRGKFQAGFYTSYFHASMGEQTGATPDGRKAREALSSSLSPVAGVDINGPTAVINSANHINMERFSNGMVLDLKFTADFLRIEEHREAVRLLIEEYYEQGGMEIQFNVLDRETLRKAQENPFLYRNLVVRVSGFSAYFVNLEKSLQNEIIKRTEHCIA